MNKNKMSYVKSIGVGMMALLVCTAGCTDGFDALNTPEHQITADQVDGSLLGQAFAQSQHTGMLGQVMYQQCSAKGADINNDHSFVSEAFLPSHTGEQIGHNPPNRVMNTAEVYFLRAEGALRGWNMGGTAEELYNEGIRSSLTDRRPDLSAAEIEAYITSDNVPVEVPSQSPTASYHPDNNATRLWWDAKPLGDFPTPVD